MSINPLQFGFHWVDRRLIYKGDVEIVILGTKIYNGLLTVINDLTCLRCHYLTQNPETLFHVTLVDFNSFMN